ncbi:MAG: cyclic nucleotide-binding domain-containing protein [Bacteroidetes bacterium]|nr:cyclic nucleotide-binding domain-containing protein [Bacteroidota bacterium]
MPKILLIESSKDYRNSITEILTMAGYDVITAADGKTGFSTAVREVPDLIICDVLIPLLDGYGVLKLVSHEPVLSAIPFISLTHKTEWAEMRKLITLGADDYLSRDADSSDLLLAVEAQIAKSRRMKADRIANGSEQAREVLQSKHVSLLHFVGNGRDKRRFKKKQIIYSEGERNGYLYFVLSGSVKCFVTSDQGKELITDFFTEGDFFGFYSLISGLPHSDSAEAMSETELILIPKKEFTEVMEKDSTLSKEFTRILNKQVADRDDVLVSIAYDSARKRVANGLLKVFEKFKKKANGTNEVNIGRTDLGNMCGVTKESTIRILSDLKEEKLIDIVDSKIIVLQQDKLRNLVN